MPCAHWLFHGPRGGACDKGPLKRLHVLSPITIGVLAKKKRVIDVQTSGRYLESYARRPAGDTGTVRHSNQHWPRLAEIATRPKKMRAKPEGYVYNAINILNIDHGLKLSSIPMGLLVCTCVHSVMSKANGWNLR